MGVKLELVPTQWSGIIPALLTGKFDVIIGGMGIRADRALKVNFTEPYNYTGMAIVANKEVAPGADSLEDFNKEDVKLVVRTGSTGVTAAEKYMPEAKLLSFDSEPQALQELLSGNAHAYVSSAPKPAFAAYEFPDKLYLPVEGTFTREPNAMAIRKGDVDTLNYLNSWITMVGSEGWFAERYQYWFETRDWESKLP
jgi:polar amino acid transport system substrate-binding protein